jgi:hypothetical protein
MAVLFEVLSGNGAERPDANAEPYPIRDRDPDPAPAPTGGAA